ncbi:MAG: histidine kinase [Butyrivibrio sp.]|nr:histidine kinase [Butyrivibrio sp.]
MAAVYLRMSKTAIRSQYDALKGLLAGIGAMLFFDAFAWFYRGSSGSFAYWAVVVTNFLSFLANAIVPVLFAQYATRSTSDTRENRRFLQIVTILSIIQIIILIVNLFTGYIYRIDPGTNLYSRGAGFGLVTSISIMNMLIGLEFLYLNRRSIDKLRMLALLCFNVLPMIAAGIQAFLYGYSLSNIACMGSGIFMFAQALDANNRTMLRQEIFIHKQNEELENMRTRIALTQLRPKFVREILDSVYLLCDIDIKRAQEIIVHLSKYLQQNIESISTEELISFDKELGHTLSYLELEKIRSGDSFDVELLTSVTDFMLPPLTVQPIVENALTHGIYKLPEGMRGRLVISTTAGNGYVKVEVVDNGVGFDMSGKRVAIVGGGAGGSDVAGDARKGGNSVNSAVSGGRTPGETDSDVGRTERKIVDSVDTSDGGGRRVRDFDNTAASARTAGDADYESEQIGISNVRNRLKIMEDAELIVKSKPGEGTTVDMIIPIKGDVI